MSLNLEKFDMRKLAADNPPVILMLGKRGTGISILVRDTVEKSNKPEHIDVPEKVD